MTTEALQRLMVGIEQLSGLDLRQRETELLQWLRVRQPLLSEAAIDRYAAAILKPNSAELGELFRRFTVPHTRFFRDTEQLRAALAAVAALGRRKVHIWIAGCSTGEEAYTVALLCQDFRIECEILASDLNGHALAQARSGRYPIEALQCVPQQYHSDFIGSGASVEVSSKLRRHITCVMHSLMQPPLLPQGAALWDLILCRNVLIYFRTELATKTIDNLAAALMTDGYLVLGPSEFHFRTRELVPARIGDRICLRRALPTPAPPGLRTAALEPLPPAPVQPGVETTHQNAAAKLSLQLLAGRFDAVLAVTLPMLIRNPEEQPGLFLSGIAYCMKGRFHEAAALLTHTLQQHPSCWPAAYFLAVSLDATKRSEDAQRAYQMLSDSAPPTVQAQALVDLLDLQLWKHEAMALARRRLSGSSDRAPPFSAQRESFVETEKGSPHAFQTPQGPHRG